MENKLTYSEAIKELEGIVKEIENEGISIDRLSEKVKRAGSLIRFCRVKLTRTGKEVEEVLNELRSGGEEETE